LTHHAGTRGRLKSSEGWASNYPLRSDPDGVRRLAAAMLREMAFVLHATRSVRAAMTQDMVEAGARPD
jgi:hypothetical protein